MWTGRETCEELNLLIVLYMYDRRKPSSKYSGDSDANASESAYAEYLEEVSPR